MKELILGGIKSGKSNYALRDLDVGSKKVFIATAEPLDSSMEKRIRLHRNSRCKSFETIEEPLEVSAKIKRYSAEKEPPLIVLDCLTLWLSNLMHHFKEESTIQLKVEELVKTISLYPGAMRIVSNEVGFGIIPESKLAREFADELGRMNQRVARVMDHLIIMFAGYPAVIKEIKYDNEK